MIGYTVKIGSSPSPGEAHQTLMIFKFARWQQRHVTFLQSR